MQAHVRQAGCQWPIWIDGQDMVVCRVLLLLLYEALRVLHVMLGKRLCWHCAGLDLT